jgi:hypothetical protein
VRAAYTKRAAGASVRALTRERSVMTDASVDCITSHQQRERLARGRNRTTLGGSGSGSSNLGHSFCWEQLEGQLEHAAQRQTPHPCATLGRSRTICCTSLSHAQAACAAVCVEVCARGLLGGNNRAGACCPLKTARGKGRIDGAGNDTGCGAVARSHAVSSGARRRDPGNQRFALLIRHV